MEALGYWRRRAFGAAGATVIAPAAVILAALAVGVGGGGLKGIGSLGQALTGPELPVAAASEATQSERERRADAGSKLLSAAEDARERRERRLADTTPGGTGDPTTGGTPRQPGRSNPGAGTGGGSEPQPRPQPDPGPRPQPEPTPPPQQPSVVRETGDEVKKVVEPVPVVGETGAAVVEELVTTADEVCPPPVCPQ
jgi:hypothetical protein